MIGSLMKSRNSLRITREESGRANFVPIQISEADTIKVDENIYELTPENYKASSFTSYTGKTMKNEDDILMIFNFIRDLG